MRCVSDAESLFYHKKPYVLQEAVVPLIGRGKCKEAYGNFITKKMQCAGYIKGGSDACKGDSGGPLSCRGIDGRWRIFGVVSWGWNHFCQQTKANVPTVYMKVERYVNWIHSTIAYGEC